MSDRAKYLAISPLLGSGSDSVSPNADGLVGIGSASVSDGSTGFSEGGSDSLSVGEGDVIVGSCPIRLRQQ